ncbi:hypothetical protein MCC01971_05160 [Bifidobacteriaceae bacterium MCC01971]|nr:hypothetical protein MCC01971_05160 [Bifidobacteriaceae bacterium MCC01971]
MSVLSDIPTVYLRFEGLIWVIPEVYLRFEGLLIRETASINGSGLTSLRRFWPVSTQPPAP